ncbi:MAG: NUDIX hydrolase N-terminal domain-containing protein [Acidimicrobiia bacterium]|nr:NUDIX hydrolase N-terminal domain-containing protein [Acidimicrobiia bacterium]
MSEPSSVTEQELLRWSEMLSALARTGLAFTESLYEQERFEEILAVAAEIQAGSSLPIDPEVLVTEWTKTIGHGVPGYVTPKVTVGAIVGNEQGELLLMQRADSGIWLYPTGWADVGYSAAEVAVKEVWEETGIKSEVVDMLGVHDGMRLGFTRIPLYSVVFHLRAIGGDLKPHPLECTDVGWFAEGELPEPMYATERWAPRAFAAIRGESLPVEFDDVRTPPWEEPERG